MKKLNNKSLKQINGGGISASFITSIVRAFTAVLDLGRSVGTAFRRVQTGSICSL